MITSLFQLASATKTNIPRLRAVYLHSDAVSVVAKQRFRTVPSEFAYTAYLSHHSELKRLMWPLFVGITM